MAEDPNDKPALLKAVELVLADPAVIVKETAAISVQFREKYRGKKAEGDIADMIAEKVISNYSYYAAIVGGTTALTGVVPGIGTVVAAFGGATADAALSMKYQVEMTMAIAAVYGHDITLEEEKRVCLIVAGLGAITQPSKGGKAIDSKTFSKMARQALQSATRQVVQEVFTKVGI
ncbi:MAG: Unknown protein, partial [uncultured Thiotrichaceae bacterium]